jgi:hypothetical protein
VSDWKDVAPGLKSVCENSICKLSPAGTVENWPRHLPGQPSAVPVQIRFEKRLGSATTVYGTVALSFVIPSVPGFPTSPLSPVPLMWFSLKRTTCSWPKPQVSTGNLGEPRDLQFRGTFRGNAILHHKPNCHLACPGVPWDRSVSGFPATLHWTRPRVRLSLRKGA